MEAALRFSSWRRTGLARIRIDGETLSRTASFPSSRSCGLAAFRQRFAALLAAFLSFRPCR
jgi:hypothetical protein